MTLGSFLMQLRKQAGYTQQNLAELLGTDRSTYAYYESDRTKPNLSSMQKIATLYGMSIDDLTYCRLPKRAITMHAPEPVTDQDLSELQFFRSLNQKEKSLILLYRSCEDKDGLMRCVRSFTDSELDKRLSENESGS